MGNIQISNIFDSIPDDLQHEVFDTLLNAQGIRIERIVSLGHTSPEHGWYDQDESEWVMVLQGEAILEFEDSSSARLKKGEHLNIPAHCKHKVSWTKPDEITIWLAVFYL